MTTRSARLTIEKLVYQGFGLGRLDGKAVFVRRAAPGDLVEIVLESERKGFDTASVREIVQPSPRRIDPPCEFFRMGCGGCQWQHLDYEAQLEWKQRIFVEFLERGHFPSPFPPLQVRSADPFHYRTRFTFHLSGGRPALFREHTHDLLPVDHCMLLPQRLNDVLQRLKEAPWIRSCESFQLWHDDLDCAGLEMNPRLGASLIDPVREEYPELKLLHPLSSDRMEYRVGSHRFLAGGGTFFQTNRRLNEALNAAVCDLFEPDGSVLDLYSGGGFFAIPLARRFQKVTAVEEDANAAAQAMINARLNGTDSVAVLHGRAEECLPCQKECDAVLADPPRAGLSRRIVQWLLERRPRQVVYVSCDPTTLVRDLTWLAAGYRTEQFILFDLFPQTFHFEVVAQLRLKDGRS